ncbi:Osiris 21 [Operophtera brumata]|uniref:Osiris 21 n=1 Tax=Operophtera brumata TaxID=104452 RepID=A0A0L7L0X0_OPEBR|nr:Osiris 21 [Operophtera brumata]
MDSTNQKTQRNHRKMEWRCSLIVMLLLTQVRSQEIEAKIDVDSQCHSCSNSNNDSPDIVDSILDIVSTIAERNVNVNKTIHKLELEMEILLEKALDKDRYEIIEGIEIKPDGAKRTEDTRDVEESEGRALFSKYTYEYRMLQKVKNFVDTHVVSINLPKAAEFMGFRSFGLNKFLLPLFIGGQILIKSLSAGSSQASYPPMTAEEPTSYNSDQKDVMGYETNQQGTYVYPDMYGTTEPEANDLGNIDMSSHACGLPATGIAGFAACDKRTGVEAKLDASYGAALDARRTFES